jgi:hypothetical protein
VAEPAVPHAAAGFFVFGVRYRGHGRHAGYQPDQAADRREFATANAKYGPPHFDIIVLENSRGDTIGDAQLLRRLRTLDRTGSFYQLVPKQVTLEE